MFQARLLFIGLSCLLCIPGPVYADSSEGVEVTTPLAANGRQGGRRGGRRGSGGRMARQPGQRRAGGQVQRQRAVRRRAVPNRQIRRAAQQQAPRRVVQPDRGAARRDMVPNRQIRRGDLQPRPGQQQRVPRGGRRQGAGMGQQGRRGGQWRRGDRRRHRHHRRRRHWPRRIYTYPNGFWWAVDFSSPNDYWSVDSEAADINVVRVDLYDQTGHFYGVDYYVRNQSESPVYVSLLLTNEENVTDGLADGYVWVGPWQDQYMGYVVQDNPYQPYNWNYRWQAYPAARQSGVYSYQ